jgi:hypothetical protein
MWPTCIGLATLGDPKSITMRRGDSVSGNAESFIVQDTGGFFSNGARTQRKIDETGTCNRWRFAKVANVKVPDDFLRNFTRIFAPLPSKHQSGIRLVIAKARIGCWR